MSILDFAFLLGPVGGLVLVPLAGTAIALGKRPRWMFILGSTLTAAFALSFLGYWFLWGKAFDYADADRPVPAGLDFASNAAMAAAAVTCLTVVGLAAAKVVASRRLPDQTEPHALSPS